MITDADVKKLKAVFATKDDLVGMEKRQDKKFKSINATLKQIKNSLDESVDVFDRQIVYHHKRLAVLEKKAGLDEQANTPPVN